MTPKSSSTSRLRGCRPLPREPTKYFSILSIIRKETFRRARSHARARPVGPAPTINTAISLVRAKLTSANRGVFFESRLFLRVVTAEVGAPAFPPVESATGNQERHLMHVADFRLFRRDRTSHARRLFQPTASLL